MLKEDMINNFLSNCALIVDDEISTKKSKISKIMKNLEKANTCFATYDAIPPNETWKSFNNIAFVILDWDIKPNGYQEIGDATIGEALKRDRENDVIEFIEFLIGNYFIPIFMFSQETISAIKEKLLAHNNIGLALKRKQILLKSKKSLSKDSIIDAIFKWYVKNPAVYTLKTIEKTINQAKTDMFIDMYHSGCNWPLVVYQTILSDGPADINYEFNEFLLSALIGRLEIPGFDEAILSHKYSKVSDKELMNVYNSSKFITNNKQKSDVQHTGDLYCIDSGSKKKYLLNITAGCDLRKDSMLLLLGCPIENYNYDERYGLVEKNTSCYVPLVIDHKCLEFKFFTYEKIKSGNNYNEVDYPINDQMNKFVRIGRLLPPYISIIQNKFASYICRQGSTRHPKEIMCRNN